MPQKTSSSPARKRARPEPKDEIRRFDVFAEYQRQQARAEGMPAAEAKGYGLWLAKVVAARRFGRAKTGAGERPEAEEEKKTRRKTKWRSLSGKPQTDKLFDKEIVDRMGREFYRRVFAPAIRQAVENGESYVDIRDRLRRPWNA